MNRIFRSIWNVKTGTFVAVPENAKSAGKKTSSGAAAKGANVYFALKVLAMSLMMSFGANVYALPVGGVVVEGGATINSGAGSTVITQSTQNAAINWQSFNIAPGESVQFVQPNSNSIMLNRILGPDPSSILGSLSANGKIFLVNPSGVLFGSGAQVNVGGLVASTLNITDSDFMAGRYQFSGASGATIFNQGSINADGGYVALLGANVGNNGVISARLGTVALAAGTAITLDVAGDGLLNVTVNQGAVNALIQNGGLIQADGGQVLLTAQAAGNLLLSVVNNTGVIQAQTIENRDGTIKLLGDMQSGTVNVGGILDASAPNGGNGGFVETSAAHVKVLDNVSITTVSAQGAAGTWLIDPVDFTIAAATGDITGAQLSANLATGNVIIMSSSGATGVNGDINVADTVTWSANKLTLNAQNNININTAMMGSGTASLSLLYGQAAVAVGNLSTYNVLAPVNLPAGPNFTTQLGFNGVPTNYTVITSLGAGPGSITTTDLQGMNGNLALHYAMGSNIDASATAGGVWGGAGFTPVGTLVTPFSGNFDGLGHTVNGLTIARADYVGLFGVVVNAAGTMLKNVTLSGGAISGASYVGNLVGHITGDILNSHSTQAVTGSANYVGGLAGWSTGNISYSTSTAAVNGASYVGGIVGWITGNIDCCFATGPVTGSSGFVGGLAGWITGNISRSYATGNVNAAADNVGGLAGWVTGNINNSYALGSATTLADYAGGLVGWDNGLINNSYSAGSVASGGANEGGLVGWKQNAGITDTNSYWDVTTSGQALSAGAETGMTTAGMKETLNFTTSTLANGFTNPTWDFSTIWTMVTNGATYPSLKACLVPATWTAVPVPSSTPVLPIVPTPLDTTTPLAEVLLGGEQFIAQAPRLGIVPARLTTVALAETPDQLMSVASPVVPPVQAAMVDVPVETTPQIYVAPHRPRKQDRY